MIFLKEKTDIETIFKCYWQFQSKKKLLKEKINVNIFNNFYVRRVFKEEN